MEQNNIEVFVAGPEHEVYVDTILQTIADAARYEEQVLLSVHMSIWPQK